MPTSKPLSLMISAGEASGDSHAAHALQALRSKGTVFTSFGMGAGALEAEGTELIADCRELAVIGIVDVVLNYHKFLKRLKRLRHSLEQRKPDLLIIVDYPDFNLKLAETAKALGIPVLFYISPKVWAWRAGRVKRIASLVSHMAVLFPFEVEIYEQANVPVTYVGNPVVHDAMSSFTRDEACAHLTLDARQQVIALLPGSRKGEVERHLPVMLETARKLEAVRSNVQFILPVAPTLDLDYVQSIMGDMAPHGLKITLENSRDAMRAADVALVASGTATLETALIGTPMVVLYIVSGLNYAIMKRLIQIPDISLVNIVAQKRVVPEYLQDAAMPAAMADDLLSLLDDSNRRNNMQEELVRVRELMGDNQASMRVADLVVQLSATSVGGASA